MNKILEQHFIKKYPKIFVDMYGPMEKTCMHWGIETADGWFFLLDSLCGQLQSYIEQTNEFRKKENIKLGKFSRQRKDIIPQLVAHQIKEKFGSLRFYYEGGDEYCSGAIDMAETLSHCICENCGKMNYSVVQTKGWIQHLCVECANEFGKDYIVDKNMQTLWKKVIKSRKDSKRSWETIEEIDLKAALPLKRKKK